MRRWRIWQHLTDYYPVKLVKTAVLPPDRSYVLGSHPHGIMCTGAAAAFCTEGPGFSRLFPGLRPSLALLAGLFRLPLYREYMMGFGMCPVSRPSLDFLLARPGNAVVIVVGGAAESLDCTPGQHRVTLQRRTGFVRLALQHGPAVPRVELESIRIDTPPRQETSAATLLRIPPQPPCCTTGCPGSRLSFGEQVFRQVVSAGAAGSGHLQLRSMD
ncbi:2-acylglycerol O-acyltransferase 3-like [Chelonoidis abingdonii]|uniref:2-acylglycerol O-acyltransferase 3-like n=1 Tax=Chelonoidis abingdonii TaxID=106734 RepID=UPI003F49B36B